jgi:hypothetical protein
MPTADHVRGFLLALDEDPVLTFRDEVLAAAVADPQLVGGLRSISRHFERHVLDKGLPDDGPKIGGFPRRATSLIAAGYLAANNALKKGRQVGDLREAIAKTTRAVERVEPDFAVELAKAIEKKRATSARFRSHLDDAAAVIAGDLETKSTSGSTALAMISGGGGGEGFCTICANGDCYPGSEAECLILIVIVIIIVVTK